MLLRDGKVQILTATTSQEQATQSWLPYLRELCPEHAVIAEQELDRARAARSTATTSPASTSTLTAAQRACVDLRNQWNAIVAKDFARAERIQADYRSAGCYTTCGMLVEDTDTVRRETWCDS